MIHQNIEGCVLIHNNIFDDERGIFFEAMNQKILNDLNVPKIEQIEYLMQQAARRIPLERLWVNPDCGLKTRAWPEVQQALRNMVTAAKQLRQSVTVVE